jgi:hypothetical protein
MHHGQCSLKPLICVPTRLLDPKFMAALRRITAAHIDGVTILAYISSTMFDTVILSFAHYVMLTTGSPGVILWMTRPFSAAARARFISRHLSPPDFNRDLDANTAVEMNSFLAAVQQWQV